MLSEAHKRIGLVRIPDQELIVVAATGQLPVVWAPLESAHLDHVPCHGSDGFPAYVWKVSWTTSNINFFYNNLF